MNWLRDNFWKSIRRKLARARCLSGDDWKILVQSWWLLLTTDVRLRLLPFARVDKLMTPRVRQSSAPDADTIAHVLGLVHAAGNHHLYPMLCLRRALVGRWLLGQRGIVTDLRFGVRREAETLVAHVWLEHCEQPVVEPPSAIDDLAPLAPVKAPS